MRDYLIVAAAISGLGIAGWFIEWIADHPLGIVAFVLTAVGICAYLTRDLFTIEGSG